VTIRYDLDHYIPRVKKSLSAYIGNIGEKLGLSYLVENGFEVISFSFCVSASFGNIKRNQEDLLKRVEEAEQYATRKDVGKESLRQNEELIRELKADLRRYKRLEKAVKGLFGKKWEDFSRFCRVWEEESEIPSGKTHSHELHDTYAVGLQPRTIVVRGMTFGFDYVAKKDSQIYFVDVKTNKAGLRNYQKKMMMKAKDFGFIPMLIRPKVSIIARLEDVTTETL